MILQILQPHSRRRVVEVLVENSMKAAENFGIY